MKPSVIATILLAIAVAGCEPVGPLPGKSLSGEAAPAPGSFIALDRAEVVQLETAGGYSVNLWGIGRDDGYYVAASRGEDARWARRIARDPNVRLRVNNIIYELEAQRVDNNEARLEMAAAYKAKYDLDAQEDFPDVVIFRLVPRGS